MKVSVIYGSVRNERQGIKAAKFIVNKLKDKGHEVFLIDPMEYKFPLLDKMHKEYSTGKAPEPLEEVSKILKESDGFVVVTGEYNHSIPAALKNILDHFQSEYFFKPAGIVSYSAGPFGGVRAAVSLRPILSELGMVTTPIMFPISAVQKSMDEEGKALDEAYDKRIAKFLDEFGWYLDALKAARRKGTPY